MPQTSEPPTPAPDHEALQLRSSVNIRRTQALMADLYRRMEGQDLPAPRPEADFPALKEFR